ncbi:MAG: BatD family protein [candidate division KSB1 bacterium]|nr:BatD family protein [candidate division KSB1 bacterium]
MKKISGFIIFLLLQIGFSHLSPLWAAGSTVSLEAKVDRSKITIGDLIRYSIVVTYGEKVSVEMPELGANLGAFEIRDYKDQAPTKRDGEMVQQREYIISTYDIGNYEIPPVTVRYMLPNDTTRYELTTEKIAITVESVKPSQAGDIRDIKPPLEIPRDWKRMIRFAVAGLLIILIAALVFWYIRRLRQGKSLLPIREKPKRPSHEIALEELEQLLKLQLLEKGEFKAFYSRISEIIRRYIEGRYFIPALEMTTGQLIDTMQQAEIETEAVRLVEDFLMSCDLVKFAKYIPMPAENQQAIDQAFEIVNTTKLILEPETAASELAAELPTEASAPAETITSEAKEVQ